MIGGRQTAVTTGYVTTARSPVNIGGESQIADTAGVTSRQPEARSHDRSQSRDRWPQLVVTEQRGRKRHLAVTERRDGNDDLNRD